MLSAVQGSAGAFCFYYIFDVSEKVNHAYSILSHAPYDYFQWSDEVISLTLQRRAELDQMPDDEEVAAAERSVNYPLRVSRQLRYQQ